MRALGEGLQVTRLDLTQAQQAEAWLALLDHYAMGDSGGGQGLAEAVKRRLPEQLRDWPGFVGLLAWQDGVAVGLMNCFTGYSTFKAKPLLNVHDVVVHSAHRRAGVARAMFAEAEAEARRLGCCKMTLEVLAGNASACAAYASFGFAPYVLDPRMGSAQFYEKGL